MFLYHKYWSRKPKKNSTVLSWKSLALRNSPLSICVGCSHMDWCLKMTVCLNSWSGCFSALPNSSRYKYVHSESLQFESFCALGANSKLRLQAACTIPSNFEQFWLDRHTQLNLVVVWVSDSYFFFFQLSKFTLLQKWVRTSPFRS